MAWTVRNGEILRVANQSQNWSRAMVDIVVDSSADLARAQRVLTEVAQSLRLDDDINPVLVEAPEVMGVESVTGHGATVRVHIKTTPTEQLRVARIFRERAVAEPTAEAFRHRRRASQRAFVRVEPARRSVHARR